MAPGDSGGGRLSWVAVKKLCNENEIDRLACLAVVFLKSENVDTSKYQLAAEQFGGNIKPESYKRGLWVITKKIKEAQARGELGDVGGADGETTMAMKKGRGGGGGGGGGKKRKAASEEVEGEEDEAENPKKATRNKGGRKGKKAKATPPAVTEDNGEAGGNDAIAETPVKTETEGDWLDGDVFS